MCYILNIVLFELRLSIIVVFFLMVEVLDSMYVYWVILMILFSIVFLISVCYLNFFCLIE